MDGNNSSLLNIYVKYTVVTWRHFKFKVMHKIQDVFHDAPLQCTEMFLFYTSDNIITTHPTELRPIEYIPTYRFIYEGILVTQFSSVKLGS